MTLRGVLESTEDKKDLFRKVELHSKLVDLFISTSSLHEQDNRGVICSSKTKKRKITPVFYFWSVHMCQTHNSYLYLLSRSRMLEN